MQTLEKTVLSSRTTNSNSGWVSHSMDEVLRDILENQFYGEIKYGFVFWADSTYNGTHSLKIRSSEYSSNEPYIEVAYDAVNPSKKFYVKDHLGSTRATFVEYPFAISYLESHDYYPFGLEMPGRSYQVGSSTKEKFTGKERDTENKLVLFWS